MDRSCTGGHGSGQEDHEEDHLKHPETMRIDEFPRVWVGSGHVLWLVLVPFEGNEEVFGGPSGKKDEDQEDLDDQRTWARGVSQDPGDAMCFFHHPAHFLSFGVSN